MKIVLLSAYYPPQTMGGAEISTHLLAKGLINHGNDVTVITTGDTKNETLFDGVKIKRIDIPLKDKPLFEKKHSRKNAIILNQLNETLKTADIIHANDFRSVLSLIEWKEKQETVPPIVATIRDYAQISGSTNFINDNGELPTDSIDDAWHSHRINEAGFVRRIFRWWQYRYNINYRKKTFRKLDGHVYISSAQMKLIGRHQDLSDIKKTVIFNPIDDSYIDEKIVPGHDGSVLFVGRIERYKGVGLLLESWQQIIKKVPEAHLKIVGDGVDKKRYEKMVENNGMNYKVTILNRIQWNRLKRVYDEAQVVVAPHLWFEPFGRTVIEAMARGKIVVATDIGGPGEIIKDNETGILFKRKSAQELTSALIQALTMDKTSRRKMGRNANNWVKDNLHKKDIARKYEEFYKEVINKTY